MSGKHKKTNLKLVVIGNQNTIRNRLRKIYHKRFLQKKRNPTTDKKLFDIAGVSEKTYRMGAKVLNSNDEDIKQRVLSGKTSISTGYKELTQKKFKGEKEK